MLDAGGLENLREEYFALSYFGKGGWTHDALEAMEVYWRKWYVRRLISQLDAEKAAAR